METPSRCGTYNLSIASLCGDRFLGLCLGISMIAWIWIMSFCCFCQLFFLNEVSIGLGIDETNYKFLLVEC